MLTICSMVSDMNDNRIFNGNSAVQPSVDGDGRGCPGIPRPLVEECISISLADLRRLYGRKELFKAAEDARPVSFQIQRNAFSVYLLAEPHRLPRQNRGVSDREVTRLWLVCMGCRRKVRKLYTYHKFPGSSVLLMAQCRSCHGLTYMSQNCGGNRWWREIARPLKRLVRRRERLIARNPSAKIVAQMNLLDQSINLLRQRARPKTRSKHRNADVDPGHALRVKRPYREISLLESR